MLELKEYQKRSLAALESYLCLAATEGDKMAFHHHTERPYRSVAQLPGLPYICLRIPTGGGKTLVACHVLGVVAKEFLQAETVVCLWLVPSNTIREQTLAALRDRQHPYRQAVETHFGGAVTVMDLNEALYVSRGTLDGGTVILVCTLAALRVEDTDGRKVYEPAGALMDHFTGLSAALESRLSTACHTGGRRSRNRNRLTVGLFVCRCWPFAWMGNSNYSKKVISWTLPGNCPTATAA